MKNGQAAFEFLMTYGWALLAVLVVIGVLAFFGVTRASDVLPEKCIVTTGFSCADFLLSEHDPSVNQCEVVVSLVNNMGQDIIIAANSTRVLCDNCVYNPDPAYENNCYWWRIGTSNETILHENLRGNAFGEEVRVPLGERFTLECNSGSSYYVDFSDSGQRGKIWFSFKYRGIESTYNRTAYGELNARVEEQTCGMNRCLYGWEETC